MFAFLSAVQVCPSCIQLYGVAPAPGISSHTFSRLENRFPVSLPLTAEDEQTAVNCSSSVEKGAGKRALLATQRGVRRGVRLHLLLGIMPTPLRRGRLPGVLPRCPWLVWGEPFSPHLLTNQTLTTPRYHHRPATPCTGGAGHPPRSLIVRTTTRM